MRGGAAEASSCIPGRAEPAGGGPNRDRRCRGEVRHGRSRSAGAHHTEQLRHKAVPSAEVLTGRAPATAVTVRLGGGLRPAKDTAGQRANVAVRRSSMTTWRRGWAAPGASVCGSCTASRGACVGERSGGQEQVCVRPGPAAARGHAAVVYHVPRAASLAQTTQLARMRACTAACTPQFSSTFNDIAIGLKVAAVRFKYFQ